MTNTTIAADFLKSLDIQSDFSSQITFYHNAKLFDSFTDLLYLIIGNISHSGIRIYTCFC